MSEGASDGPADRGPGAERMVDADGVPPTGGDAGSGVGRAGAARIVWSAVSELCLLRQSDGWRVMVSPIFGQVVEAGGRQRVQVGRDAFVMLDARWHDTPEAAKASVADMVEQMGRDLIQQAMELREENERLRVLDRADLPRGVPLLENTRISN